MNTTIIESDPTIRAEGNGQSSQPTKSLTILFADSAWPIARKSQEDESAAQDSLARQCGLATNVIQEHHGEIVKAIGGSVIAEFSDPAAAVHAAVEMQRMLALSNPTSSGDAQATLRIGIYSLAGDRPGIELFGSMIQVAASITKLARGAQILISGEAYQAISNENDLNCRWVRTLAIEGRKENQEVFEVGWAEAPSGISTRYRVLSQVGAGGMGIVFKVRDQETKEIVALKILKSDIAGDPAMQENLRREVCLARKVTHKNVCRIHEFNRSNGIASISMEFVEGESLLSKLRRGGPMPWSEVLISVRQICAGLREAHVQGIVHRDLKPANIMVDLGGGIKIMDFGIAREFQGTGQMTGTLIGTPAYMAPEQVEIKPVDARTDIYALGLLLYEMVTGVAAFGGETPIAVALKQLRDMPKRPREIVPALPAYAEKIIMKCLQKDPAMRFQSVDDLAAALRRESDSRPAVSQWDRFISDVSGFGLDLQRGCASGIKLAENFIRRQNWQALKTPRAKKALAVGLGAICLIGGLTAFSVRGSRRSAASSGTSVMAAPNPRSNVVEASSSMGSSAPLISSDSSTRSISGFNVNLGPASAPETVSPQDSVKSNQLGQPAPKIANEKHNEKTQLASRVLPGKSNPRQGTAKSLTMPADVAQQTIVDPHAPTASAAPPNDAQGDSAAHDLSSSAVTPPPAGIVAVDKAPESTAAATTSLPEPYLEVGTFKDSTWADQAVDKLNQLGYRASSVRKNRLWIQSYQVRVGPYTDAKELGSDQKNLTSQGFKPHPVK